MTRMTSGRTVPQLSPMIGTDAFCPKSGATLSRETHHDEHGRRRRAVTDDGRAVELGVVGELTNGAVRSGRTALLVYFKRCHGRHHAPDEQLYRRASLALKRLKSSASGREEWDVHVWYALKRRLDRRGYDVGWMDSHAQLRCPFCTGRLRFDTTANDAVVAACGTDCNDQRGGILTETREILASLYAAAFADQPAPSPADFLQF